MSAGKAGMGGALAGIRVVDLTTVVVGPTATLFLADYGADVIKVEAPGGDLLRTLGGKSNSGQLSGKFTHFNRNKRSLALDLKREEGREALHRLLATADVFIANVRPAALARLGLDAEALRSRYPRLVVCNLMGFGSAGRYRDRPAYDTIIQGFAGVTDTNRRALGEPRFVPMVFADHIVGLIATQCIIAALFQRDRTGEGQAIEVPMFENVAAFVLAEHMGDLSFVPPRGPSGDLRVLDPLGKPVATKDGYICVSANTDAQAFALFDAIGRPELKSDPAFFLGQGAARQCARLFRDAGGRLARPHHRRMARHPGEGGRSCRPGPYARKHSRRRASRRRRVLPQGRSIPSKARCSILRSRTSSLPVRARISAPPRCSAAIASKSCANSAIGDAEIDALVQSQVTIDGREAAPAAPSGKRREA